MNSLSNAWLQIGLCDMSTPTAISPVHLVTCDPFKELIWTAGGEGHMSCFYSPSFTPRIRVRAHTSPLHLLQPLANGVLSCSSTGIRFHSRGGVLQTELDTASFTTITSSLLSDDIYTPQDLFVGASSPSELAFLENHDGEGLVDLLAVVDIMSDQVVQRVQAEGVISSLTQGRGMIAAAIGSSLTLHDPRTLSPLHTLSGLHVGGIKTMHVKNDRLITCGYSTPSSSLSDSPGRLDNMLKIFDLRTLRPLPPLLFPLGGAVDFAFLPNFSSTLLVASPQGFFQILDAEHDASLSAGEFYNIENLNPGASISALALSTTGDVALFGDTSGCVHAWSDKSSQLNDLSELCLNSYSASVEYIDPNIEPPPLHMDENSSLALLPLPPYTDDSSLLSHVSHPLHNPPPSAPIDSALFEHHVKHVDFVGYISWKPQKGRKGQDEEEGDDQKQQSFIPNDLSTLSRYTARGRMIDKLRRKKTLIRYNELLNSPLKRELLISKEYARVSIKIPKLGLYAFDFSSYNKTNFAGLDNLLPNSYCNPVIQCLYFLPSLRATLLHHLCDRENCLTCELGFLFHMLDRAKRHTAEPRNFLRALRQLPEASGLGLLDIHEHSSSSSELLLAGKIQDFVRFLLEQLHKEEREMPQYTLALQEKQQQLQQLQYTYNLNQQRRHRTYNISISSLQQVNSNFDALRGSYQMLQQQFQSVYEDVEKQESYAHLQATQAVEKEMEQLRTTHIEKVFGCTQYQSVECQGVGGVHPGHTEVRETTALHFKLTYPTGQPEVYFDSLLTSSLQESLPSTRLYCAKCSTFTYQSSSRTLHTMPTHLNLMCNVQTDEEWEWWKGRDGRYDASTKKQVAQIMTSRGGKPTNLFNRFNQAAGEPGHTDSSPPAASASSSSFSPTSSTVLTPEEQQDTSDNHFLPHYLFIYLDRYTKQTKVFRILPTHAKALAGIVDRLKYDLKSAAQHAENLRAQSQLHSQNISQLQTQQVQTQQQLILCSQRMMQLQAQQSSVPQQKYHLLQQQLHTLNHQRTQHTAKQQQIMNHLHHTQQKLQQLQQSITQHMQSVQQHQSQGEAQIQSMLHTFLSSALPSRYTPPVTPSTFTSLTLTDLAIFELTSVVAHIADPPEKDSPLHSINGEHLVAHIKVDKRVYEHRPPDRTNFSEISPATPVHDRYTSPPHESPNSPTTAPADSNHDGSWYVFNDFVIRPSNGSEACRFAYVWKQPSCAVYRLMSPQAFDATEQLQKLQMQHNPFMSDNTLYSFSPSLSIRYQSDPSLHSQPSFQPLLPSEVMDHKSLVAIDCEFVSVQHELTDVDDLGDTIVVRPSRLTLARVSVVRGLGPGMGVPFIDDYIATSEPVVDYLTKYSGVFPGDLDRSVSSHHLVTLKSAYIRLRALVERGVHFVGHGLKKDFQMINLILPASQVFDTVELFSLANQRKLGLKFLSKHLLALNIQTGNHDSIEDARTALQLYHKYTELVANNTLQTVLHQLYQIGHRSGFKV